MREGPTDRAYGNAADQPKPPANNSGDLTGSDALEFALEPDPPRSGNVAASLDEVAVWYTGQSGSEQSGPYSAAALRKQVASGTLSPRDLVWKAGMSNWLPAQEIAELNMSALGSVPVPGSHGGRFDSGDELWRNINSILSNGAFYRILGRTCVGLGVAVLLASVLLSFWHFTWFTGAILFLAVGIGGEAAGQALDILHRIESELKQRIKPTKEASENGPEHH